MYCQRCGSDQNFVVNTRHTAGGLKTWRRRKCLKCCNLFTTHETLDMANFVVLKRDGRRERFSKIKLFSGILWASIGVKLKQREKTIEKISNKIEKDILKLNKNILTSEEISQIVTRHLWESHISLFLRFVSYRSQIKTRREFFKEVEKYREKDIVNLGKKPKAGNRNKVGYGDFG